MNSASSDLIHNLEDGSCSLPRAELGASANDHGCHVPCCSSAGPAEIGAYGPRQVCPWLIDNVGKTMQSKAKTIEEYIDSVDAATRATLKELDTLIGKKAPAALGGMKYGMPTYEIGGRMIAFNAQKHYFSVYANPEILTEFRSGLTSYSVGKSCIRFRKLEPELKRTLAQIIERHGV